MITDLDCVERLVLVIASALDNSNASQVVILECWNVTSNNLLIKLQINSTLEIVILLPMPLGLQWEF
jgi:hypothetical protein